MSYKLYSENQLLGESELELGDPPMGIAFGQLIPTDLYHQYQSIFESHDFEKVEKLNLYVVSESGEKLEPSAGVAVEDYSKEMGEQCIEVSILGLDAQIYEKLFQHHVQAYENQFK